MNLGLGLSLGARCFVGDLAPSLLEPGATWNGTAGSGFAVAPTDPTRTTAKPMLRLMTPDYQFFTDELPVGVFAAANNGGSLFDNLGLDKVRFHFEGRSVDVMAPSYQTFDDVNGNPVTYLGWWVTLKRGATNGHARLYVEAFPKDTAMQNRVIGPFQFSPQPVLYDKELEIAATPAEIAGTRYKTLPAAFAWLRDNSGTFTNPRITFTEAGNYAFSRATFGDPGAANGWITVRATAPIVFNSGDPSNAGLMFVNTNNWRIMGQNITFDMQTVTSRKITRQTSSPYDLRNYWFDGVNFTISGGRYSLLNGTIASVVIDGAPWLTECSFTNGAVSSAQLVRGCTWTDAWGDVFNNAACVVGTVTNSLDNSAYTAEISALTVTYGGAEATATIAISGGNNASGRVVTLKYGATTTTFAIDTGTPAGGFYTVADVVAWINTKPGFTASTLDNTRRAATLTKTGSPSFGAFADTNVKSTTLTLVTAFDIHSDWYQMNNGVNADNTIIYGNRGFGFKDVAFFLFQPTGVGARDVLVANNAFDGDPASPVITQFQQSLNHLVFAHNSLARQGLLLSQTSGLTLDSYSLIANNAATFLTWDGTPFAANLVNNVLDSTASVPANSTGTVLAGNVASKFVSATTGNFTPQGALVANLKTSLVQRDLARATRASTAPAGALA